MPKDSVLGKRSRSRLSASPSKRQKTGKSSERKSVAKSITATSAKASTKKRDQKKKDGPSFLSGLRKHSVVVADTADFNLIAKHKPQDATTNPTLILQAVQKPEYQKIVDKVVHDYVAKHKGKPDYNDMMAQVCVAFGTRISKLIPGYVSTEVDARLSFDTEGMVKCGRRIIELYRKNGVPKSRILIKVGATWEGVRAAEQLRREGINCNLTLIFSIWQAILCANAGVRLISPFVGRILDWYKKRDPDYKYPAGKHPGCELVREIHEYYKTYGHKTIVMAASLRLVDELAQLAGCDRITIPVKTLDDAEAASGKVKRVLLPNAKNSKLKKYDKLSEKDFRWNLFKDKMATDKLEEGIRSFADGADELIAILKQKVTKLRGKK